MPTDSHGALEKELFIQRKKDHVDISLSDASQAYQPQFERLQLLHNPLPEINFDQVQLNTSVFGHSLKSPLFISSMTLGHGDSLRINQTLMCAAEKKGWMMGVGSQRRQLFDQEAASECEALRAQYPDAILFGNIGLSQVIHTSQEEIQQLVDSLGAQFMVVHTNPLQEAIQPEGTPQFAGGLQALEKLCSTLKVPVVLKETGCGFSPQSLEKLKNIGLAALDVSGLGGTHWGRVEGLRQSTQTLSHQVAQTFANWGVTTVDSLLYAHEADLKMPVWASGGVRSGLDAAKLIALGAAMVGFAKPLLEAAMVSQQELESKMDLLDFELRTAMFCLGLSDLTKFVGKRELIVCR